jgi:phage terminase small subunit
MKKLTPKQRRFIEEYLIDLNATQAAIRAGYAKSTAEKKAPLWVGKSRKSSPYPGIWDAVKKLIDKRSDRTEITQDWVIKKLVENVNRAMQAEPVYDKDGNKTGEYVYQGSVANRALELLGKHVGMFTNKEEGDYTVQININRVDKDD